MRAADQGTGASANGDVDDPKAKDLHPTQDDQEKVYVLEANPNPQLAHGEDFADSAEAGGLPYDRLIQRILNFGLSWRPQ